MEGDNGRMLSLIAALSLLFPAEATEKTLGPDTTITVTEVATGETFRLRPELSAKPLPPCSTFKIWNTAIGLETGVLKTANEPFYRWDGKKRWLDAWNRDLTLKEAYDVSCVPAYQELARKIGAERMATWLGKLHYGDENMAAGLDVFWLPGDGRKPLRISADRQAELLTVLVKGESPFSEATVRTLREVMQQRKTEKGTLYAKTGTGTGDATTPAVGWYVGWVEGEKGAYVFAAVTEQAAAKEGEPTKLLGPEMRKRVEALLEQAGLL